MLEQITEPLLSWYDGHARVLPWREDHSPYRVWVSEIMLQQTRVEAVKPFFERFVKALPDVQALARCPEDELLKLWEGLGYYNRVRNMQKAAQIVTEEYDGAFPADYEKLLALPGIGHYTAGAIGSIAFGIRMPAVDGNVLRVLSRVKASYEDILKQSVKTAMEQEVKKIIPAGRPGDFNQALIELGAIVCVPNGKARCGECPLAFCCRAKAEGIVDELPKKKAKKERRVEARTVLILREGDRVAIRKRPSRGLLAGLYELPNLTGHLSEDEVLEQVNEILVVEAIAKKEGLGLKDGDYESGAMKLAEAEGYDSLESYEEDYGKDYVQRQLLHNQVTDFLYQSAKVTEVTQDEAGEGEELELEDGGLEDEEGLEDDAEGEAEG